MCIQGDCPCIIKFCLTFAKMNSHIFMSMIRTRLQFCMQLLADSPFSRFWTVPPLHTSGIPSHLISFQYRMFSQIFPPLNTLLSSFIHFTPYIWNRLLSLISQSYSMLESYFFFLNYIFFFPRECSLTFHLVHYTIKVNCIYYSIILYLMLLIYLSKLFPLSYWIFKQCYYVAALTSSL